MPCPYGYGPYPSGHPIRVCAIPVWDPIWVWLIPVWGSHTGMAHTRMGIPYGYGPYQYGYPRYEDYLKYIPLEEVKKWLSLCCFPCYV
eukprot:g68468.t1